MRKSAGLNLLPSSAKFQALRVKWFNRIKRLGLAMAVVYTMVGVALIAWFLWARRSNQLVKREFAGYESRLAATANKAGTSKQIKYRAKVVAGVLQGRFEYSKYLLLMRQILPPEVQVEKLELVGKTEVRIDGVVSSRVDLEVVEKRIEEINGGKMAEFSGVELKSLNYGGGQWKFSLLVSIRNAKY